MNSAIKFLIFYILLQLCHFRNVSTTSLEELEKETTSTVLPLTNQTSTANSTALINKFNSHHEPSTEKSNKLPVNWHYFTWPLLGSIIVMSSIAWIVIKNRSGTRVLYMSRIPRIIRSPPAVRQWNQFSIIQFLLSVQRKPSSVKKGSHSSSHSLSIVQRVKLADESVCSISSFG